MSDHRESDATEKRPKSWEHKVNQRGLVLFAPPGESKSHIVTEHHWLTLTTLGLNGFIMSSDLMSRIDNLRQSVVLGMLTAVSLYSSVLIVQRAALHEDQLALFKPVAERKVKKRKQMLRHTFGETVCNVAFFPNYLGFVAVEEFSGALFYLAVVVGSLIAVLLLHPTGWIFIGCAFAVALVAVIAAQIALEIVPQFRKWRHTSQ